MTAVSSFKCMMGHASACVCVCACVVQCALCSRLAASMCRPLVCMFSSFHPFSPHLCVSLTHFLVDQSCHDNQSACQSKIFPSLTSVDCTLPPQPSFHTVCVGGSACSDLMQQVFFKYQRTGQAEASAGGLSRRFHLSSDTNSASGEFDLAEVCAGRPGFRQISACQSSGGTLY